MTLRENGKQNRFFSANFKHIELKTCKESIKNQYLEIYGITSEILNQVLGKDRDIQSMIDVRAIVKYFGIEIVETELRSNRNFF